MAFFECEFPTPIGFRAVGGPGWHTTIKKGLSPQEQRNGDWTQSRGQWQINLMTPKSYEKMPQDWVDSLIAFWEVVGAQRDGFRFKDHKRFKAVDQPVVTNPDGDNQLAVSHVIGGRTFVKFISKPITSAIVDYKGNPLPDTVTGATVDPETGITGAAPGTLVSFEYHHAVRFDNEFLPMMIEESDVAGGKPIVTVAGLMLVEVPPPNF